MSKILIFNVALAPYRIDFYNYLSSVAPSSFYFTRRNVEGSFFDMNNLISQCHFTPQYVNGIKILGRLIPRNILSIIRREKPTHIFVSEFSPIAILTCIYKRIFGFRYKIISICDDSLDMLEGNEFSVLHKISRHCCLPLLNEILLLDSRSCDWYKRHYKKGIWFPLIQKEELFRKKLVELLPSSQKAILEYDLEDKYIILFVGRLIEIKNLDFLLSAIKNTPISVTLVVVGDGVERKKLEHLASEFCLDVRFIGWQNNDNLLLWYNVAHLLVLPSLREPFGAVVNEALMAGCRVCVSSRAGSACLVDEKNGHIFDPKNLADLQESLAKEFSNKSSITFNTKNLRESKMKFHFTQLMNNINKFLDI